MDSIRDALIESALSGNNAALTLIAQAREVQSEANSLAQAAADRLDALYRLVKETFDGELTPADCHKRPDIVRLSESRIEKVSEHAGSEYDHVVSKVQYAWTSKENHRAAVQAVLDPPRGYKTWDDYNQAVAKVSHR